MLKIWSMCQLPPLLLLEFEVQQISPLESCVAPCQMPLRSQRQSQVRPDSPITWWNICGNCGACWSKSELIGKNNLWLGWGTDGGFPLTWYHTCNGGLIKTLWDRCRKNPGFQLQEPGGSTTYLQIRNHLSESDENSSGPLLFTKRCRLHRWEGDDWCQEFWRRISTRISNGGQHVSCHYCEAYD